MPLPPSPLDPAPALEEWLVTAADGTGLHVEVRGEPTGPTVVLVHGWTTRADSWTRLYDLLGERFRLVSYDQRGHGRSDMPGWMGWSPEAMPEDLEAVVETMVPEGEQAILVGHSMGAMTIVAAAGLRPKLFAPGGPVAGAVLASTGVEDLVMRSRVLPVPVPRALDGVVRRVGNEVIASRVRFAPRKPDAVSRAFVKYVNFGSASPETVEFLARQVLDIDAGVRGDVGRIFGTMDLSSYLPDLTVPTVVIGGDADRLTPVWHARHLAERLPDVEQYVELPGVGHMSPLEAPEALAGAVERLADKYLPRNPG